MTNVISIPTYEEMLSSLPEKFRTDKVKEQLKNAYDIEKKFITEEAERLKKDGKSVTAIMLKFSNCGSQWIADFEVRDKTREVKDQYNWHGQNTSQWTYAGCICFSETSFESGSDYIISRHH